MREILFRGKTAGEEWIEGFPMVFTDNYVQICRPMEHSRTVIPETVGQYTGLTDKNGKKIFEGDILKGSWNTVLIVFYDDISASYRVKTLLGSEREISYYGDQKRLEIIGNIHDNAELLKGE